MRWGCIWRGVALALASAGEIRAVEPGTVISQYGHTIWRLQMACRMRRRTRSFKTSDGYFGSGLRPDLFVLMVSAFSK